MQDKKKRNCWLIASLLIMILIFSFSADNATASNAKSSFIVEWIYPLFQSFLTVDVFTFLVRKAAHFSIYALLGISVYQMFSSDPRTKEKALLLSLAICFLYACSDEAHQLLSEGRSGQFSDVLLDTCGSLCGAYFTRLLRRMIRR